MNLLWITLALVLVAVNAFFVAAEFSMVKLRATRVEEIKDQHGLRGKALFHIHQHLDAYLSACQLGITIASLGLGWIGGPAFRVLLEPLFQWIGFNSPEWSTVGAFFVAFSLISFLHIVVGELMPKSLAIRQAEKLSLWTAPPLYVFYALMYPAIWLLNGCSNFLLKRLGLAEAYPGEHLYSPEEIKLLLNASHSHGNLSREEVDIIEHTFDLAYLKVTEVMRSCDEIVILDLKKPLEENIETMISHHYSRYPVYQSYPESKTEKGEIIGIIHVKDLLSQLYQEGEIKELNSLIRPVLKVSPKTPAIDLLQKFRKGMSHFALIYKEGQKLIGFITLDNLLQVLIGRIKDEFHRTQVDWLRLQKGSLLVKGACSLYSLEQALEEALEEEVEVQDTNEQAKPFLNQRRREEVLGPLSLDEENIETLADLIVHHRNLKHASNPSRQPKIKVGDVIEFKGFDASIEKMEGERILRVKICLCKKKE